MYLEAENIFFIFCMKISASIHYFENSNDKREITLHRNSTELLKKQLSSSSYYMKE